MSGGLQEACASTVAFCLASVKPYGIQQSMDAERLALIGEFLFPGGKWRNEVATYLGVRPETVWRWVKADKVPKTAVIALEMSFSYGIFKEREVVNG